MSQDLEPVISDFALAVIEDRLRLRFLGKVPDNSTFVTFLQEPKVITDPQGNSGQLPRMAVFAVISDHPTKPWAPRIMTHGTVEHRAFLESAAEHRHYVNSKPDPALVIMGEVLKGHLRTLSNLRDLIN